MSMLLPHLEKRGLIERRGDRRDKRVLRLFLTPEGKDVTEKAMKIQTGLIDTVMETSSEERCLMVAEHMEKIIEVLLAADAGEPANLDPANRAGPGDTGTAPAMLEGQRAHPTGPAEEMPD